MATALHSGCADELSAPVLTPLSVQCESMGISCASLQQQKPELATFKCCKHVVQLMPQ